MRTIKQNKNNNMINSSSIPFIIAGGSILIILFNVRANLIFEIIVDYIKGEIYVTYDDFPNISEWIQIVSTILFSFLLWKATCESNKLNENNLKLQKRIKKEEDLLKYIRVYNDITNLYKKVESARRVQSQMAQMGIHYEYRVVIYGNISISEWTKQYSRIIYDKNRKMVNKITDIIQLVDDINTIYDIANDVIATKAGTPKGIFEKQIGKMIDSLAEMINELMEILKFVKDKMDKYEVSKE